MRTYFEVCATNTNCAQLHIDRRVPGLKAGDTFLSSLDKPIPPEYREFVADILAIPGVESMSSRNHQVGVTKGSVFLWGEIEGPLVDLVRRQFYADETAGSSSTDNGDTEALCGGVKGQGGRS